MTIIYYSDTRIYVQYDNCFILGNFVLHRNGRKITSDFERGFLSQDKKATTTRTGGALGDADVGLRQKDRAKSEVIFWTFHSRE